MWMSAIISSLVFPYLFLLLHFYTVQDSVYWYQWLQTASYQTSNKTCERNCKNTKLGGNKLKTMKINEYSFNMDINLTKIKGSRFKNFVIVLISISYQSSIALDLFSCIQVFLCFSFFFFFSSSISFNYFFPFLNILFSFYFFQYKDIFIYWG